MTAARCTQAADEEEPFYVSASRWRNYLLSHSTSFRELQEERQRGWQSAALDAWYAERRQPANNETRKKIDTDKQHATSKKPNTSTAHSSAFDHADIPILCERYRLHVRRIFACATRHLFIPKRREATFLDLGCAPGGLSKYLLEDLHWSGVGVTLPQSEGGIVMDPTLRTAPLCRRYVLLEGDITTPPETWRTATRHALSSSSLTPISSSDNDSCEGEGRHMKSKEKDCAANVLGRCFWFVNGGAVQDYGQRLLMAQQQQQQQRQTATTSDTLVSMSGSEKDAEDRAKNKEEESMALSARQRVAADNTASSPAETLSDRLGKRARGGGASVHQQDNAVDTYGTVATSQAQAADTDADSHTVTRSLIASLCTDNQQQRVTNTDNVIVANAIADDEADAILPWFTLFVPQLRLALTHVCDGGGMMLVYGAPYCASLFILLRVLDTFTESAGSNEDMAQDNKDTCTIRSGRITSPTRPACNSTSVIHRGRNAGRLMSSMHSDMLPPRKSPTIVTHGDTQAKCVHILETMHITKSPVYVLWERMRMMGNEAARARLLAALDPHSAALSPMLGGEDLPCATPSSSIDHNNKKASAHCEVGLSMEERLQRKRAFWLGESSTGFALALEGFARHRADLERIWQKTTHVLRVRRERAEQARAAQKMDN